MAVSYTRRSPTWADGNTVFAPDAERWEQLGADTATWTGDADFYASAGNAGSPPPGQWVGLYGTTGGGGAGGPYATGVADFGIILIPQSTVVDQVGFEVTTSEAVNAKALLYQMNAYGVPTTLVVDSGGVSCSTTGNKIVTLGSPVTLKAGAYATAIRSDGGSAVRFRCQTQPARSMVQDSFNRVQYSYGLGYAIDPGTYAATNSTLSAAAFVYNRGYTSNVCPVVGVRRQA